MVRYPHIGTLTWTEDEAEYDVDGNPVSVQVSQEIQCRVQLGTFTNRKDFDFSGKVFCRKLEKDSWMLNSKTFTHEGKVFKIIQFFNFQRHCELWLE